MQYARMTDFLEVIYIKDGFILLGSKDDAAKAIPRVHYGGTMGGC